MLCNLLPALSLFLCHNVEMLFHLFWKKTEIFQKFILRAITVHLDQDKIIFTSINSVSNLVVTGENPLRKHQMKKISVLLCFFQSIKNSI